MPETGVGVLLSTVFGGLLPGDAGLALWDLVILMALALVAGAVYGFAGFGAALIFMPVASGIVPVEMAVAAFSVSALASLVTLVPQASKDIDRKAVLVMVLAASLSASAGIWVLRVADVSGLRWGVVGVTFVTLISLISGWRYATEPSLRARSAIGLATGFVGGATGLMGPVMVLFQLAGRDSVARSRATALVFLTVSSLMLLPLLYLQGILSNAAVILGVAMLLPYGAGSWLGRRLFSPSRDVLYRWVAYGLIAVAIVLGLPIWG